MRRANMGKVTCLILIAVMISSAFVPGFASGRENSSEFAQEFAVQSSTQILSLATGWTGISFQMIVASEFF